MFLNAGFVRRKLGRWLNLRGLALTYLALSAFSARPTQALEIAFLRLQQRNGQLIYLEPGVPYSHVAISYRGQWLHTSPAKNRVEIVATLAEIGGVEIILSNPDAAELQPAQVEPWLGLPYDREYDWSNNDKLYCTELVAKLLGIPPSPMAFDAFLWPAHYLTKNGLPGLSPSELFAELAIRNYRTRTTTCENNSLL